MKTLTKEWIDKAEEDRRVCERELRVTRRAGFDAVSFHAQQCAEKYLKAVLQESGIPFPKTHDLEELVELLLPKFRQFATYRVAAKELARLAVEVRYPGNWATRADAETALQTAQQIRKLARAELSATPRRRGKKSSRSSRKRK